MLSLMKLLLDRLPPSLQGRRETLVQCLLAMGRVRRVHAVYLFGSHARGDHFFRTVLKEGVPIAQED
jgi:hypothetical protein